MNVPGPQPARSEPAAAAAPRGAAPLVQLRGLTKTYRVGPLDVRALVDLDLDVAAGDFVAIVGASGSGKTTLLNLLGLLDRPNGGRYLLDGADVAMLDDDARTLLRNHALGFVFQSSPLLPRLTAAENVALPLLYRGEKTAAAHEAALAALDRFGLASHAAHHPGQLSGGQQQRVALARAIVGRPRLLLADEPTAALDPVTAREVIDELVALHERDHLTLVLVTHDPESTARATRRYELVGGRLAPIRAAAAPGRNGAPAHQNVTAPRGAGG